MTDKHFKALYMRLHYKSVATCHECIGPYKESIDYFLVPAPHIAKVLKQLS